MKLLVLMNLDFVECLSEIYYHLNLSGKQDLESLKFAEITDKSKKK
jgi:hypothetical protein